MEPPKPAVQTRKAAENLRQRAKEEIVDGQVFDAGTWRELLHRAQRVAVEVALHDPHELGLAQLRDGGQALGQDLAVAAMGAEDEVIGSQVIGHAHRRRLLADGEVGRPLVLVGNALVDTLVLDPVQHGFEFADEDHVAVDAHQVGARRTGWPPWPDQPRSC